MVRNREAMQVARLGFRQRRMVLVAALAGVDRRLIDSPPPCSSTPGRWTFFCAGAGAAHRAARGRAGLLIGRDPVLDGGTTTELVAMLFDFVLTLVVSCATDQRCCWAACRFRC